MTKRFTREVPELPQGPNTRIDPRYPRFLLSDAKGYVFITMAKDNSRKNCPMCGRMSVLPLATFYFVGDMAVHGSVRSGFSIQADNIRIMGMVEGRHCARAPRSHD